jgi:hypothetical protein
LDRKCQLLASAERYARQIGTADGGNQDIRVRNFHGMHALKQEIQSLIGKIPERCKPGAGNRSLFRDAEAKHSRKTTERNLNGDDNVG